MELIGYQLPVTSYQSPVTSHQLPVTSYQLPVTSYQLPVTSYQLPVTSYQLPVTSQQLPVNSYQLLTLYKDHSNDMAYPIQFPHAIKSHSSQGESRRSGTDAASAHHRHGRRA